MLRSTKLIAMFQKMAGWVAVSTALVGLSSCTGYQGPYGSIERNLNDPVTIEAGQIIVKRYKVSLAASSNPGTRVATVTILGPSGCVRESDGGGTCPPDGGTTGPVAAAFLDGSTEVNVFERCGVDVACEQTLQVRLKPRADLVGTVVVSVALRARVLNASFASDALQITPE